MKPIMAIRDNATQHFDRVHSVRAVGEALRDFTDAINDPQNKQLHNHPEDFELWLLGNFDEETGALTPQTERIARGQDVKR